MASPLTPTTDSVLNVHTPPTARRYDAYEVHAVVSQSEVTSETSQESSPFIPSNNDATACDKENVSPSKSRHSRVLSGATLSPLKILSDQRDSIESRASPSSGTFSRRNSRRLSPDKRFPIKVGNSLESPRPTPTASPERTMSLEDALSKNSGLKRAIEIFEDDNSDMENEHDISSATVNITPQDAPMDVDDSMMPDESMISTFSTFSAVPNLTTFAKLGQTPEKMTAASAAATPRANGRSNPSPSRPSRPSSMHEGNTTNLLDFTESLRHPQKTPAGKGNPSPLRSGTSVAATPSRQLANLIDFDIPPMPTPRSVPSITPRELESLKSNFLSEISSLKASLSGKEAEVQSLKTAVGEAEKRVGESMEQLREIRTLKDQLAEEKEGWETRGRQMESVLRSVKDEIITSRGERQELEEKLEESEKRREAAEMMHQEAESKMAGMRAGKESEKSASPEKARNTNHEVELAVERVARELHALYKGKHETKVAALKKSYETRWEKKVHELENHIQELNSENERLRGQETTMMRAENAENEELRAQAVRDSATMKELTANIQRLEAEVQTIKCDNDDLRGMLEKERVEKGELVQLAEEMMNMQSFVAQPTPAQAKPQMPQMPQERAQETKTPKRPIMPRGSGLRAPGSALRAPHERTRSAGGLPRPGGIPRSGIMSSIEKMGSYRGRGAE